MLESLQADHFSSLTGQAFQLARPDGRVIEVTLEEVRAREDQEFRGRVPFSMLFRGPRGENLRQGLYRLGHAELGSWDLLMVPVEPDGETPYLEVVIS